MKSSETLYIGGDIQVDMNGTYTHIFGGGYSELKPEVNNPDSIKYYYYTKDHLGNIRNVLTQNNDNTMTELQHTSYYPFGGIIADTLLTKGRDVQNRMYNGKEQDFSNNLFWLDYGARQYDPTRGQFTTPNPLTEKYYGWNYYTYCVNNPMNAIDPDGRDGVKVIDSQNKTITIKANFYVVTEGGNCPYTKEDIEQLNKETSNTFNKQVEGKTISKGKYKGYSLKFEINFIDGGTLKNAKSKAYKDVIFQYDEKGNKQCLHEGNTLSREDSNEHASFKPRDNGDVVGGETAFNRDVTMNSDFDSTQNRNHEFGHAPFWPSRYFP